MGQGHVFLFGLTQDDNWTTLNTNKKTFIDIHCLEESLSRILRSLILILRSASTKDSSSSPVYPIVCISDLFTKTLVVFFPQEMVVGGSTQAIIFLCKACPERGLCKEYPVSATVEYKSEAIKKSKYVKKLFEWTLFCHFSFYCFTLTWNALHVHGPFEMSRD